MESKGLSEESITILTTSDNGFTPKLAYIQNSKIAVKFKGNFLQGKLSFTHGNVVNFYCS